MRSLLVLLLSLSFVNWAQAEKIDVEAELAAYSKKISTQTTGVLYAEIAKQSVAALGLCVVTGIITAGNYGLDTLPGGTGEILGKVFGEDYQILDGDDDFWSRLKDGARGGSGGAVAMAVDLANNLLGFLKGDKPEWPLTKKVYASSNATAKTFSAKEAACVKTLSKIDLAELELRSRY